MHHGLATRPLSAIAACLGNQAKCPHGHSSGCSPPSLLLCSLLRMLLQYGFTSVEAISRQVRPGFLCSAVRSAIETGRRLAFKGCIEKGIQRSTRSRGGER